MADATLIPTDDVLLDKFVGCQGAPPLCKDVIHADVTSSWIFQIWMDIPFNFFSVAGSGGEIPAICHPVNIPEG